MPRVVVFDEFGGPDVMHVVDEPVVEPTAGEVRVRIEAFAVNPLDQMMRSGTSPAIVPLPHARLGVEGTGVVDALGPGVTGLETGDPRRGCTPGRKSSSRSRNGPKERANGSGRCAGKQRLI